jgi:hypothetical protein
VPLLVPSVRAPAPVTSAVNAMKNRKFVLVSDTGYHRKHDDLLRSVLAEGYELFCVVGVDCELWEEVMDEVAVGDDSDPRYITTTSHPGETENEVIEFAKMFSISGDSGVHVVHI